MGCLGSEKEVFLVYLTPGNSGRNLCSRFHNYW